MADIVAPDANQLFNDIDSYKDAKRKLLEYATSTKDEPGVRYFRLFEQYKNEAHYWILNGSGDVPKDHKYTLSNVGPVSKISVKLFDNVRYLVVQGAVFSRRATFHLSAPVIEFRDCVWSNNAESVLVLTGLRVGKIVVVNPTGNAAIELPMSEPMSSSSSRGASLLDLLLLASMAKKIRNCNNNQREHHMTGEKCSICLDDDQDAPWTTTTCKHKFHTACIEEWEEKHSTCPLCRTQLLDGHDEEMEVTDLAEFEWHTPPIMHVVPSQFSTYSFGLRPEDIWYSGTANFSRMDTVTLRIYPRNYNVALTMEWLAGIQYSN
jgi:hypothetical protein